MIEPEPEVQYISDEKGHVLGVIVPIRLWREMLSERKEVFKLDNEAMQRVRIENVEVEDDPPASEDTPALWDGATAYPFFGPSRSLEELAAEQGVSPVTDFDTLLGDFWPEDEPAEEFVLPSGSGGKADSYGNLP